MSLAGLQQQAQAVRPQLPQWHTSHLSDSVAPLQQQATRATSGTAGSKPAQPLTQQGIVHVRAWECTADAGCQVAQQVA